MNKLHREELPLLNEDLSDEELRYGNNTPKYRRLKTHYKSRTKYNLKGAAQIIGRWPEFWSSSLMYWWAGVTMIAIVIFFAYNSAIAYAMLPSTNLRYFIPYNSNNNIISHENSGIKVPHIFMHVIVNHSKEIDLIDYLPHIQNFSDKYKEFNFKLYVVLNDTEDLFIDDFVENNEIAMEEIWTRKDILPDHFTENLRIEHISLKKLLDESPLQKNWRSVPQQFIEFLLRAISIWDKGGIAINPIILTPYSPHTLYIEKLQSIMKNFTNIETRENTESFYEPPQTLLKTNALSTQKKTNSGSNKMSKANNIQDIIENLENDPNEMVNPLDVAESNNNEVIVTVSNVTDLSNSNLSSTKTASKKYVLNELASQFLKYIFKPVKNLTSHDPSKRAILVNDKSDNNKSNSVKKNNKIRPMIISAKAIYDNKSEKIIETEHNDGLSNLKVDQLSIDLKGNIIATNTACHSFIGTVFSDFSHYIEDESITDFIIAELSRFCKGVLSSCKGIDIILL